MCVCIRQVPDVHNKQMKFGKLCACKAQQQKEEVISEQWL